MKKLKGITTALCAILFLSLSTTIVSCKKVNKEGDSTPVTNVPEVPEIPETPSIYKNSYANKTTVGYEAEYLGTVKRNIPKTIEDEGLVSSGQIPAYPTYGIDLNGITTDQKDLIINESSYLCGNAITNVTGTYDMMDKNGYLYLNGQPVTDSSGSQRKLYKHTASTTMYYGQVSDDEPGIIKKVTLSPRGYDSYSVTGVYAPAGEVIKIEIPEADMKANGSITVRIGQGLYNGKANNIWNAKTINRFPIIVNAMKITPSTATLENGVYTAYVGSYLGGPVYIHNTTSTVSVTISGGVRYSHFILGYTTQEEFAENAASSAPYFDLEVRNYGVLHSGPKIYAQSFSYDDLYKVAILWEKVSLVSTQGSSQGIVMMYDPFVAAGAAVAFPTQMSVNCPAGWMSSALNYRSITENGAWGVFHEYNHNFQYYGVGNGGEVTNNGMNLVEYSLFTRVSSSRTISNYGGVSDWANYTSATWALDQMVSNKYSNGKQGLALYATLLHNFGADNYIQSKLIQRRSSELNENYAGYFGAWTKQTHNNMTYYFNELLGAEVDEDTINTYTDKSYPMFVPVSSVYQTGRSYMYDGVKQYTTTMQPFRIPYDQEYDIDLTQYTTSEGVNSSTSGTYVSGSIVIPDGFSYRIKSITNPENGTITKVDDYHYKYIPSQSALKEGKLTSGKINVTLGITKDDGEFLVDDVDLTLEFEQNHDVLKNTLTKTVYNYTENLYDATTNTFKSSAAEEYENNFASAVSSVSSNHTNPALSNGNICQDCNSEVWNLDPLGSDSNNVNDGVVGEDILSQAIVLNGKIYVPEDGKYRITLAGRYNVALFVSTDGGKNYSKACEYTTNTAGTTDFPTNVDGGYLDLDLKGETYLYYKAVMIRYVGETRNAFMGVGWGEWTTDEDGNPSVSVSHVTSYRDSYENLFEEYTSDYFYTRDYTYDYSDITTYDVGQSLITDQCVFTEGWGHGLSNLVDGNNSTYMHTNYTPSEEHPVTIVGELDERITANQLIFDGSHNSEKNFLPKAYKISVSNDGENWTEVCNETNSTLSSDGWQVTAKFDDTYTFRYYKIEITETHQSYIALRGIIFQKYVIELDDGDQLSLDEDMFTLTGEWETAATYSSFGHVFVGKEGDTIEFEFEGTRLGILSSDLNSGKYKVEIDGVELDSIQLKELSTLGASYISDLLGEGTHTVRITCLETCNFDSIIVW
jgi:hypothetical protein